MPHKIQVRSCAFAGEQVQAAGCVCSVETRALLEPPTALESDTLPDLLCTTMHTGRPRPRSQRTTRVQLQDYDESLLLDRSYVPLPQDGFGEECEPSSSALDEQFGPIHTSWAVVLYLLCVLGYLVFLVCPTPYLPRSDSFEIQTAVGVLQATLHLVVLLLAMMLESYLRLNHRRRQQLGYLRFYRNTRHLLSIPFYAAAMATAALLLAELWPAAVPWLPLHAKLVIISAAECLCAFLFAVMYMGRVWHHNRTEVAPDAQLYLQSALYKAPDTSLRQQDAVVEQQGELIRFLQRRCDNLAREVLNLQAREDSHCLEHRQGATAVHLEHLLATREQELRALLAEKELLFNQNRQTWSLLEERTHENSQLQLAKQQHGDENGRLRATLEEWSHRNAKVEQRLNAERQRADDLQRQLREAATANGVPDERGKSPKPAGA